jgi:serine/threonine-protein kinase
MQTDRNLLFGVLAMQADLIDASQFAAACGTWSTRKTSPLSEILKQQAGLTDEDCAHIEYLLERTLKKHQGDAHQSLLAVAEPSAWRALESVHDPDIRQTMDGLPRAEGHVVVSTMAYTPETLERYTLTRLHAKGGIGQVWLARDPNIGREVALKELRPERADNPAIWARFLEEARITGQLEHPGIVPVYEMARSGTGEKPFYTMRFVRGQTLSEATRAYHRKRAEGKAGPLDLQALLQVFVGVCHAVGYAHSRGVVHRDLKGQNVVLGDYGEALVLDWGLAKLVDQPESMIGRPPVRHDEKMDLAETQEGQALGTPGYMAPEQAEGKLERIDRRTDVYGLGAILYEILTGEPPFRGDDTATVLRRVVHEPPEPPRRLNHQAPAALESMALKALSKRPEDRYARVEDLARDVQCFMADEPVSVYREPLSIRVTRWGRRHRTTAVGVGALLLSTMAALLIGTILINGERAKAEASFRQARQAVDDYFTTVSESKLLNVPGMQPLRKELLDRALKYYQSFIQQRGSDPSVKAELAATHYRAAWITAMLGSREEAVKLYQEGLKLYEELVRSNPNTTRYQVDRAIVLNDLGNLLGGLGRRDEALATHQKALALREALAQSHPQEARYQNELSKSYANVGNLMGDAGKPSEALASYETARAINEGLLQATASTMSSFPTDLGKHYNAPWAIALDLAIDYRSIGYLLYRQGRTAESVRSFEKARDLLGQIARENPDEAELESRLAGALMELAFYHGVDGRHAEAFATLERAFGIVRRLAAENPTVEGYQGQLISCHREIGRALRRQGRLAEAEQHLKQAKSGMEGLMTGHENEPGYRRTFAYIDRELGWIARMQDRPAEALHNFESARVLDAKEAETSVGAVYDLACDWAVCIPLVGWNKDDEDLTEAERAERQRLGDEAMKALRQAVAGGWTSHDHLTKDEDLDGLRSRADFQELLRSLGPAAEGRAAPAGLRPTVGQRLQMPGG